jgi:ParB-like chromosome segregation protein Spo0J
VKYGFIVPIITNKDLLIADGEQRLQEAKAIGMKQVQIIRLPVEDVDRRLLRQVLNKLKGEHEPKADAEEFQRIIDAGH